MPSCVSIVCARAVNHAHLCAGGELSSAQEGPTLILRQRAGRLPERSCLKFVFLLAAAGSCTLPYAFFVCCFSQQLHNVEGMRKLSLAGLSMMHRLRCVVVQLGAALMN